MIAAKNVCLAARTARVAVVPKASSTRVAVLAKARCSDASSAPIASGSMAISMLSMMAAAAPAFADEAAVATEAAADAGINPGEVGVVLAPLVLYGLFNLYRNNYNPKATFQDFLLFLGLFAILYNIFSILVLKQRLF